MLNGRKGLFGMFLFGIGIVFVTQLRAEIIDNGGFEDENVVKIGPKSWYVRMEARTRDYYKLSDADFKWNLDKDVYYKGKNSLKISHLKPEVKSVCEQTRMPILANKKYRMMLNYKTQPEREDSNIQVRLIYFKQSDAGLEIMGSDKSTYFFNVKGKDGIKKGWREFSDEFITPEGAIAVSLSIFLPDNTETFWLDDVSIEESATESKNENAIKVENRTYLPKDRRLWKERELDSKIIEKFKNKGYIVYVRPNPRDLYPDAIPKEEEINDKVRIFATPGEYEPLWFSVYGLKDINDLTVRLENGLLSEKGISISTGSVDIRIIRCWKRRTEYYSMNYWVIPEVLDRNKARSIKNGENVHYYITVKVPDDLVEGKYEGNIIIGGKDIPESKIGVSVTVLPFRLEKPVNFKTYITTPGKFYQKPEENSIDAIARAFTDIYEHGGTESCIVLDYGEQPVFVYENEKIKLQKFTKVTNVLQAMKKLNRKGFIIIHMSGQLEHYVAKAMGIANPPSKSGLDGIMTPEMETEKLKTAFKQGLDEINRIVKEYGGGEIGWYYMGIDECARPYRINRYLWQAKLAKEAGYKTSAYMTGEMDYIEKSLPYTDLYICGTLEKKVIDRIHSAGSLIYVYGSSGNYGSDGGLMPGRLYIGLKTYRSGVDGSNIYRYYADRNLEEQQFKSATYVGTLIYHDPDEEGMFLSSLEWEGIREGIDDYWYAYTLGKLIKEIEKDNKYKNSEVLVKAKEKFNWVMSQVPLTDQGEMGKDETFNNDMATKCRWIIAQEITNLKSLK